MQHCVLSVGLDTLHFYIYSVHCSFIVFRMLDYYVYNRNQDVNSDIHKSLTCINVKY